MRGARLLVQMNVVVQNAKKYAGFNVPEFFPHRPDKMGLWPKGVLPGGKKLQLHTTDLTDSAGLMGLKDKGEMADDGFVESDGLVGGFWWCVAIRVPPCTRRIGTPVIRCR